MISLTATILRPDEIFGTDKCNRNQIKTLCHFWEAIKSPQSVFLKWSYTPLANCYGRQWWYVGEKW